MDPKTELESSEWQNAVEIRGTVISLQNRAKEVRETAALLEETAANLANVTAQRLDNLEAQHHKALAADLRTLISKSIPEN